MFPALLVSYVVSVLFVKGGYTGLASLADFNVFVARIAVASFAAYLIGQIIDINVFQPASSKSHLVDCPRLLDRCWQPD